VDEKREGPSEIRNRLAASSNADWLLPLDDDDLLDPDFLEVLLPFLEDADIVYPWCRVEGSDFVCNRLYRPDKLFHFNFIPVAALVRRELWVELGGMRKVEQEDYDLWRRAMGLGARIVCCPEILWTYRFHGGNVFQGMHGRSIPNGVRS
jgi:hypothetical protein